MVGLRILSRGIQSLRLFPKLKKLPFLFLGLDFTHLDIRLGTRGIESKLHDWTGQGERGSARARVCGIRAGFLFFFS